MATKPEVAAEAKAPAKSKKMLFIIIGAVLVLALGGGAFVYMGKQHAAEGAEEAPAKVAHVDPKHAPVYLPLDNMVVNLADPGGEKVAQVGITLQVVDAKASDSVKAYLPVIRSSILMLIAQRTSEELLTQDGKQKLAKDILHQASLPFGGVDEDPDEAPVKKKKSAKRVAAIEFPVIDVLFSSFIVQ